MESVSVTPEASRKSKPDKDRQRNDCRIFLPLTPPSPTEGEGPSDSYFFADPKPGNAPPRTPGEVSFAARGRAMALVTIAVVFACLGTNGSVHAWPPDWLAHRQTSSPWNIASPTFGGLQVWTDELVYLDWRIQRNTVSGHYRLLDDQDYRQAWGTFQHCRARLDDLKHERQLAPMQGTVVIVMHGLFRSRHSMSALVEALREDTDWTVINVSYASTRAGLEQHAQALAKVLDNLGPEVNTIHFVAHSMGNLIVRRYLHDVDVGRGGGWADPRLGRIVMLAPPNQGARAAEAFRHVVGLEKMVGRSTAQLARDWDELSETLATPAGEFGILAGGKNDDQGRNRWLDGDDDFVVTVDETRLAGAHDFMILPVYHRQIIKDPLAHQCTVRFLQHGYFVSPEARHPLPIDVSPSP